MWLNTEKGVFMNSLLWFALGTGFGYYFPNVVSKVREMVLNFIKEKKND